MSGIRGEEEDEVLDLPKLETVLSYLYQSLSTSFRTLVSVKQG